MSATVLPLRHGAVIAFRHLHVQFRHVKEVCWLIGHHHLRLVDGHLDHGNALCDDAQLSGGTVGEVDDAPTGKGTAVDDTHDNLLAVGWISHLKECPEGMGAVGTDQAIVVEPFPTGGTCSVCAFGIEGGLTFLLCRCGHSKGGKEGHRNGIQALVQDS